MAISKKQTGLAAGRTDPFGLLRRMTSELDRAFGGPFESVFRWPGIHEAIVWSPEIDVFEKDNHLITKVDLPGMKKDDVKVEVAEGRLAISGERKAETEEKKESFYRCEREYGSFYRTVPLPEGAKTEEVKATFADGVLEVRVPLSAAPEVKPRTVPVEDGAKAA